MATVHVGANADPHRASFWLAPPEGWLVPAEGRRASTTPYVLTSTRGTGSTTTRGGHSHPRQNDGYGARQERLEVSPNARAYRHGASPRSAGRGHPPHHPRCRASWPYVPSTPPGRSFPGGSPRWWITRVSAGVGTPIGLSNPGQRACQSEQEVRAVLSALPELLSHVGSDRTDCRWPPRWRDMNFPTAAATERGLWPRSLSLR